MPTAGEMQLLLYVVDVGCPEQITTGRSPVDGTLLWSED